MDISEKALETFKELILYNKEVLPIYASLDKDFRGIKNYHYIYKRKIKPVLISYREKSKAIDQEMRVAEAYFKGLANFMWLERRINKVFEEREKHKSCDCSSCDCSKRIPK